jgi:hypothetical protein
VFGLFGLVVLALAVAAVRLTPSLTWVAALLGLPLVVLTVVEGFSPDSDGVVLTSSAFHAVFYYFATFTVLAWAFAYVFAAARSRRTDARW